jgi:hypothetical protein
MVNGFCFGAAAQLIACDFAIAAEDGFGLSEVNWGILPGGFVGNTLVEALGMRDAIWFAVTGETFDARVAERARLINRAVPRDKLRSETVALAERLMKLNPHAVSATKQAIKNVRQMGDDAALDYLAAKSIELRFLDREGGRDQGMKQFLDEKSYRPGLGAYHRPEDKASGGARAVYRCDRSAHCFPCSRWQPGARLGLSALTRAAAIWCSAVPDGTRAYAGADRRSRNPPDWFPDDTRRCRRSWRRGDKPAVRACAMPRAGTVIGSSA